MNILITGAKGFVGRNLTENLKNIRDGKNRTRPNIQIDEIYEYDIDSTAEELDEYCAKADFVFNLAGVNRPKDPAEFKAGNFGFASTLLDTLKKHHNTCPVMLSSSIQATLAVRDASAHRNTDFPREQERICSSPMQRKPERRCWFTASRTLSASG